MSLSHFISFSKFKKTSSPKKAFQRATLVFLCSVLALTVAMPNQVLALGVFDQKRPLKQTSVLPAQKVDTTKTQAIIDTSTSPEKSEKKQDRTKVRELENKRTAFTSTYLNKDGTKSLEYSPTQQNFKQGESWQKINNKLEAIESTAPSQDLLQFITNTKPVADPPSQFKGRAGVVQVEMKPLAEGLKIQAAGKTLTMKPIDARNVKPARKDDHTVIYKDAWPNVDLEYELRGETVKEVIVLKNKSAQTAFNFNISGGTVINHPTRTGELTIEGMPDEFSFSALTLDVNEQGVISEQRVTQAPTTKGIQVVMDKDWLRSQPATSFPMRIDPTFGRSATSWWMFKSDGYGCNASNCYANIGTINSGGWKAWRTYMQFPYSDLAGKKVLNANIHGIFKYGVNGITDGRWIGMGHAPCISFYCQGAQVGSAYVGTDFDINFTQGLADSVNAGDFGAVWSFWGEEGAYKSYKPYYDMVATVVYDTPTPIATAVEPADKQVTISTQPTLRVNPVSDADGDTVQYYYRVSTSPDAETGAVINSGWISATQWTVPDGILQDGTTYYWHVYTLGATQTNPNWVRSFKLDLRTGKDSTQAYDTVGPMGIDLATGNATTSASTHTMNALGGSIGLNMSYDSPAKTQKGLTGEYWNVAQNYPGGIPSGPPILTRNDQDVNFSFSTGSPGAGINSDWFFARWKGYFVAPTTGSYSFGASNDDSISINVNGQAMGGGCYGSTPCYGTSSISLQAGQAVPIDIQYLEATGDAYARVYVKGAVSQQTIVRDWLQTEVKATASQYGLAGRYYTDDGSHNFPSNNDDPMRFMMARNDSKLSFNWGLGGPAPGLQTDNFMVRWTGYVTAPTNGTYTFGSQSDDGVRVKLNNGFLGAQQTVLDSWQYTAGAVWGSTVNLTAGQQVPITVEYFEAGGPGSLSLLVRGPNITDQEIPVKWLTPKASALPDAWRLGADVDGNVGYERLRVAGQNIILEDSTRATHEYIWTGSGYKPPINEDGQLTRNINNTYTLIDTDGRTYVFDAEGKLTSLTVASDDRNPASLKYEYSGDPSRLMKISDGVTATRYGTLNYKGINEDGNCSAPSGFDAVPDGMLCAFKTSDGDVTKLYYKAGQLSRIEKPGSDLTNYEYDDLGRIVRLRDSVASDAIAAGIRIDDSNVLTELSYDQLGRASAIKAPAPTTNASRTNHTFEYLIGATQMHITGASEPNGFSKRVEYDSLLRTSKETDVTNLSNLTEWDSVKDLQLSSTDATGLKSTIIYDDDDRAVENYGPAPAVWYGTDRRPLAANVAQVPKTTTGYDEGLAGPSVNWYNVKGKSFIGNPKLVTQGIDQTQKTWQGRDFRTNGPNFTPDAGMDGYGFSATGKVRFPSTGTYTLKMWHDDGARVTIDDQSVINDWDYQSEGVTQNAVSGTFNAVAGKAYRFKFDYLHTGNPGAVDLWWAGPGITDTNSGLGTNKPSFVSPGYSLATSQTAYDSQLGNVTTKMNYSKPEYGQVQSATLDPTGLNYTSQATYESPGAGYLRQTSKTLPGGATTSYDHYSTSDTVTINTTTYSDKGGYADDPCTNGIQAIPQGGKPKGKTDPTGRKTETVYNHSGDVIATRYNTDSWTCTSYDARGRVQQTIAPSIGSMPGRTIANDYAVGGNPLITETRDSSGTIRVENDLLGRTLRYVDVKDKETLNTYDNYGKLTQRVSPIGTEAYEYDQYDRLTKQKLDGVTFATVTYDEFSRIQNIAYRAGISLSSITRDTLGRENGNTYTLGSGQTLTDQINRYTSGDIQNGTENGTTKAYAYDKAGRLTGATIGDNNYAYGFGVQNTSCSVPAGYDAGKDGNRTSMSVNGQTTTFCYNSADQLVSSSDVTLTNAQYDSHGNTTSLGDAAHKTSFSYDSSDRNTSITSGDATNGKETTFIRDAQNRITQRIAKQTVGGSTTTKSDVSYGFTGSSDTPDFLLDSAGNVQQKYLTLPGDVLVTIKPGSTSAGATTYSLPNIHGDIFATVNADGALNSTFMTGPFGEVLPSQITQPAGTLAPTNNPANTADGTSYQYVGQFGKLTDLNTSPITGGIIQMGARVYIPTLGRFLSVDPIEGGAENNYVYATDSVNDSDLSGKCVQCRITTYAGNYDQLSKMNNWNWQKRNEFVAWHQKNLPWLGNALQAYAVLRGSRAGSMKTSYFATSGAARAQATKLGYNLSKGSPVKDSRGQEVFKRGNQYISRDVDGHSGGAWKVFNSKGVRTGTYSNDLKTRIGN